jgi:hypothetical protein
MNKSDQNIEQLFSDNLGSQFEMQGSTSWQQLLVRRNKARFFQFKYGTVNIYYVAIIGCAVLTAILYFANKPEQNSSKQLQPLMVKQTISNPETMHHQNTIEETKTSIPIETIKHELPKEEVKIVSNKKDNNTTQNTVAEPIVSKIDSTPQNTVIPPKQEEAVVKKKITKTVVVVQKSEVTVKDTIVNVVTKKIRKRN